MDVLEVLRREGELAAAQALGISHVSLRGARDAGTVVRSRRGHCRLAELAEHLAVAHALSATVSHRSAALHQGSRSRPLPRSPR